ncbi:MAG: hypothetical protein ABIR81_09785 [Ginsengibacter sp.]
MENDQNQQAVPPLIDETKAKKDTERYFNLVVDDIAYRVEFEPFFFNEQVRYYVSINAGTRNVFVWDSSVLQFRAIDDAAGVLPVALEQAISVNLETQNLT